MQNVAIYIISDGMGGAEQVVWQTINGLKKLESIYLIVNNEIAYSYANIIPDSRVLNIGDVFLHANKKFRIIRFLLNNRFYSLIPFIIRSKSKRIAHYLNNNDINIIHSHLDYALYSSLHIKKIRIKSKLIHTVHGVFGLIEDKLLKPSLPLSKIDFVSIDKLIFVSRYVCNLYKTKSIPVNSQEVIYNGIEYVDNRNFIRVAKTNEEFEILYVGGSKYVKGFDILVETVDLLRKTKFKNKIHVVVLGYLSDNCDFVTMIRQRGLEKYFRLVGFIEPPAHLNYFKSADILFMPSRSEALPIAAIEAVSLDLPVIASNVGGLPEIIRHEENGLLGSNMAQEYAEYILNLIPAFNKFLDKTRNYNQKIRPQFEAKNMCQKLLHLY